MAGIEVALGTGNQETEKGQVDELVMQIWIDENRGKVTGGKYAGNLLRASAYDGPHIDMLMPGYGWQVLDSNYIRNDKDAGKLAELKVVVDLWLSA